MRNEIFSHIEPDVINCDMFFNGVLGEATLPFIQEMEKFIVTKNVDIKSYSKHFLGLRLQQHFNDSDVNMAKMFAGLDNKEKLYLFEKMKREYIIAYKRRGVPVADLCSAFGFDYLSTYDQYMEIDEPVLDIAKQRRRVRFDGVEFPYFVARHIFVVGQSRGGKSVTVVKCTETCLANGWTVVDINDSNGRMETGAAAFSLFDKKFIDIIKDRWQDARIDNKATAQRMVNDIDTLGKVVMKYTDEEDRLKRAKVIYYHPLIRGIPERVPVMENFHIEFFVFSVIDFFEMVNNSRYRRIFKVFGEEITPTEETYLFQIKRYIENEGKLNVATFEYIIQLLSDFHSSNENVVITQGDGSSREYSFGDKTVLTLVRKLDRINSYGLFKPHTVDINGEMVVNPLLFDVAKIVKRKGIYNCLSVKWGPPDLKYFLVSYFIDTLMDLKRTSKVDENVVIMCRELFELAPPKPKEYEMMTFDSLKRVCAGGADLGVRLIADSQQFMQVSREIKRNIHGFIIHKVVDSTDKDEIRRSLSKHYFPSHYRDLISSLRVGESVFVYGNQASLVRIIPVSYMSKIEGTDTFSMLMAYCDEFVETAPLFNVGYKVAIDARGVDDVGVKFIMPAILKRNELVVSDMRTLRVLTGLAMVCRKRNFTTIRDVVGCTALLFPSSELITPVDIRDCLIGSREDSIKKFVIVDGDVKDLDKCLFSLDCNVFGYDDVSSLSNELFIELLISFGIEVGKYIGG
jgi:hypothetical protein